MRQYPARRVKSESRPRPFTRPRLAEIKSESTRVLTKDASNYPGSPGK
jgi:hypothetical protein